MDDKRQIKDVFFLFIVAAILLSFWFGSLFGRNQVVCPVCPPEDLDFSLFWEAWRTIENKYVDFEELDEKEMTYGAIRGLVDALDDPHSMFLDPEESKVFSDDISGEFEGVGMEIGIRDKQLQVVAPLEGTPAQRAGLRAGDEIKKIDGESTIDITIEEAVRLIRGPKGTEVNLTIFRKEWGEERDVAIRRDVIEIPSLKWELQEENIAYIKLYHFTTKAESDFRQIAIEIANSPAEKIVLDLRNNPGGFLGVVQEIGGWFLKKGEIIVIEDFGGPEPKNYLSEGPGLFSEYPIVCLINQGSASGAEILAGALRDNRSVVLVGESSFGKGTVQELAQLRDGSSIKITIAKWLTPKGDLITDVGLKPDIEVELTEEDFKSNKDPQLDKALEIIKKL